MKTTLVILLFGLPLCGYSQNETSPTMPKNFVQTNGEFVKIGGIMVKTNSPLDTDYFKQLMWRNQRLEKIMNSDATNRIDRFVEGAWQLVRDYPKEANGYQDLMGAMDDYQYDGQRAKARALADKVAVSSAPRNFKFWAKGFLNRLDSSDKVTTMKFTAVDGRKVDLSEMKGKVVLVDFWATTCGPCVAELPRVKAAYERFHAEGFDVVGISCDTDKSKLEEYVKEHGIVWPQYFDGKQQDDNKFAVEFGIDGIPHMFLVDKKGLLRFDNVRATDKYHAKGDTASFEEKISKLLSEQ
ncbi:MAG: TlpA family protein disulfide reductase [Verrucomicrobiota bacterium]|nr:TlpA family protein disulfide reductase [Verrucomicrobiota bacterium]